jgi:hypothetical protein
VSIIKQGEQHLACQRAVVAHLEPQPWKRLDAAAGAVAWSGLRLSDVLF